MQDKNDCGEPKIGRQVIKGGNYIRRGEYPWYGNNFCNIIF